jgi:glycosyltransferase involved in cell wall biosynthesis
MGGGTKILHTYAEALSKRGHDILVVSVPQSKPTFISKIRYFINHLEQIKTPDKPASYFDNSIAKHKIIESDRPIVDADLPDADIVIATWWETAEWVNNLSASKGKKIYFVQGHEIFDYLPIDRVIKTYYYPMQKIAVSKWLGDIMANEYGDKNCILVPNSIDHHQFYAEDRSKNTIPTVGFLYSNSYIKGVDTTLKAIKLLKQSLPNLRAISFGTEQPLRNGNWDEAVDFYLNPKQNEIRGLYSQCDVWLSASISEGFNLTAMEAMACGTPIISTKTGWPVESVRHGINGFLIDFSDVDAMVQYAKQLFSMTKKEWYELSKSAIDTVKDSSWDDSVNSFEDTLLKLVKR